MNKLIDCKAIREEILEEVKREVRPLPEKPRLVIVSIGHDDASEIYVRNKIKTAESVGIEAKHLQFDADVTQEKMEAYMESICVHSPNHAIMLQLPIPDHLDKDKLINLIPQNADVDGLTDLNMGMLVNNHPDAIVPATAQGVFEVIKHHRAPWCTSSTDLTGVNVTVINRSQLIGKPLQALLTNHNGTVTLCHSKSDIVTAIERADVVVTGIGNANFFNSMDLFDGQLIIDCGINRDKDGKVCGDVDYEDCLEFMEDVAITPVPSGVGVLTTACLMMNVVKCYKLQN